MERFLKTEDEQWKEYAEDQAKPTHVEAEETVIGARTARVYLTAFGGYENFCALCGELLMVQEIDSRNFDVRIFCAKEKCIK